MGFAKDELTHDRFLDGKLNIWQPSMGYRAGADPVFLAASVGAKAGETVLELGCGVGVASLCLGRRVAGLKLTGVEIQPEYADLARNNAAENNIPMEVISADFRNLPNTIRAKSFNHVIANPPYFKNKTRTEANNRGRELALAESAPLADWVDAATRRLKPGGLMTFIQKADRLPDLLAALDKRVGGVSVKPLVPRSGRNAEIVILSACKGARAPFRLFSPLVLHDGPEHVRDGENYSVSARLVLREGKALEFQ